MTTTKKRNNKGNNRSRKIVEQCEVSLEIVIKLGIEVGLRRGKFEYTVSTSTSNRRSKMGGAKKKEGDAHAITSAPTWPKSQQTPHNPTYPYSPH